MQISGLLGFLASLSIRLECWDSVTYFESGPPERGGFFLVFGLRSTCCRARRFRDVDRHSCGTCGIPLSLQLNFIVANSLLWS
jgi:hypothetical protein